MSIFIGCVVVYITVFVFALVRAISRKVETKVDFMANGLSKEIGVMENRDVLKALNNNLKELNKNLTRESIER